MVADPYLGIEAQVRHAAHDLGLALAPQADAEIELRSAWRRRPATLVDDDETRLADLLEHNG